MAYVKANHDRKGGHDIGDFEHDIELDAYQFGIRRKEATVVLHDQDCDGQLVILIEGEDDSREYLLSGWVQNAQGGFNKLRDFSRCGFFTDMLLHATMQMRADHDWR